jgi:hypothetical protein
LCARRWSLADQPVHDFIDDAVSTHGDDHVKIGSARLLSEHNPMPSVLRGGDFKVERIREGMDDEIGHPP